MTEIRDVILQYYERRGLTMPNESQAFQFLVSEVGELADALVSSAGNFVRNNPDRERDIEGEAGDVLMMLYVTLMERNIDPFRAMIEKFKSKGFKYEETENSSAGGAPDTSVSRRCRPHYALNASRCFLPLRGLPRGYYGSVRALYREMDQSE